MTFDDAGQARSPYLAWRALVAHPLRRIFGRRGTGLERFQAAYVAEGLAPTTPEDRALGEAASACVACGLCELGCDLAAAAPAVRALGLHAAFRLYSRSAGGAAARGGRARRVRGVHRLRRALSDGRAHFGDRPPAAREGCRGDRCSGDGAERLTRASRGNHVASRHPRSPRCAPPNATPVSPSRRRAPAGALLSCRE